MPLSGFFQNLPSEHQCRQYCLHHQTLLPAKSSNNHRLISDIRSPVAIPPLPPHGSRDTLRHSRTGGQRFRISHIRVGGFMHGFDTWIQCKGTAIAKRSRRQCTMRSAYIQLSALQMLFTRCISFKVRFRSIAFFSHRPFPACIYITFHSRSTSNRYGSLHSPWQWA